MKIPTVIRLSAAASLLATATASAQGAVRLQLAPGSEVSFTGTSTLHAFTCTTKRFDAYIDVDQGYRTRDLTTIARPIAGVQVTIPLRSLACGGELEGNMLKTLHASEHPYAVYKLTGYTLVEGSARPTAFAADTRGRLAIAGADNPIAIRVNATRDADGTVTATGEQKIRMTDFGVKPPTFMFGALRVGDELTVRFTIKATAPAVSAAMRELGISTATVATTATTTLHPAGLAR